MRDQALPKEGRLDLGEEIVEYRIRYRRRHTIGLYVLDGGRVEVRAPVNYPSRLIERFVVERSDWLQRTLAYRRAHGPVATHYRSGAIHLYLGEPLTLDLRPGSRPLVRRQGGHLVIHHRRSDEAGIARLLRRWYHQEADRLFPALLDRWYPAMELAAAGIPALRVRAMRRRWGSCSRKGGINLNLWLMRAPEACVEYVVVHELCHLREFNHGPRFHALMDALLPDWRRHSAALDAHQRRHGVEPLVEDDAGDQ